MVKQKTLGEHWDAGCVPCSPRLSDEELLALADRTEALMEHYPSGAFLARKGGRPRKGDIALPTAVRSLRLPTELWAQVAAEADREGFSINRWIEAAILEQLGRKRQPALQVL